MFLDFLYCLREQGLAVTTHDWLALMQALRMGLHEQELGGFYQVARCLLVTSESDYDAFDRAFAKTFRGVEVTTAEILDQLEQWLADPKSLAFLDDELRAALQSMDIETLRRVFLERLREQKERHEGGSRWIGTGGTSAFGQGGAHPSGVRIGGAGGGRSAMAVADARRFRAYRRDVVLDTRQIAAALRRLRKLGRSGAPDELDLDDTVDRTARNCGDLEIVMRPPRNNDLRVILMMDVGGSMTPHARLVSRLFSAAHQGGGFKDLKVYYFHNCVYGRVYQDAAFDKSVSTKELIETLDPRWRLILVGDAYMHPGELSMSGGSWWDYQRGPTGYTWLARLADRFPYNAWINPEPETIWGAPTISEIRKLYVMFGLTLTGLEDMVSHLRKPVTADRRHLLHLAARDME